MKIVIQKQLQLIEAAPRPAHSLVEAVDLNGVAGAEHALNFFRVVDHGLR